MPEDREIAVEFDNVTFSVGDRSLVSNLNFSVHQGEALILLGRSGSGKTTTMKLINGLFMPTGGEVRVNGRSTKDWDLIKLRRTIGYVIQEIGLFPHFTIARNVGLVPSLEGWNPKQIKARVHELLQLVGLDPVQFSDRYPHELSGGQRQRVGVARAIAADPPILLMDEPFGALDPITRLELQQEFRKLQQQLNKTVIFVTHDIQEAFVLASRIGLMETGRLVVLETPTEFLKSSQSEAIAFLDCLGMFKP
ncbi:ATP-binding cassette domain-containing protein [Synechocystis sp. PCC 7509]|uniref:ATP-binding cassette domain-containing protein n=1 Tax=Synechocystis sp. PCC 7509 TaxID=927677 RepID=UPI0002ABED73|nr:ATP-binding cassette domain-containing protein [Synechocystis sp. PCC 7509]